MLLWMLLIGFVMIGTAVWFTYQEVVPFLDAVKHEIKRAEECVHEKWYVPTSVQRALNSALLPLKIIKLIPMLIPALIDVFVTIVVSGYLGFGTGLVGGVTGLFGSNVLSAIIYYHTHIRRRKI